MKTKASLKYLDLFKNGQNCHRVHSSNERSKSEAGEEFKRVRMDCEVSANRQVAHVLVGEDGQDLRNVRDVLERELKGAESPPLAQTVETEPDGEDVEEGAEDGEDDDGEEGGEELLVVEGDGGVEDDRGEEDVEEEVGSELGERVGIGIEGVGDEDPEQGADEDENARLWKEPFKDGEMVEEDLEDDGEDDQA